DPEVRVELVVAVVRLAARAGVGMPAAALGLGCLLVLDGDVDAAAHGRAELDTGGQGEVTTLVPRRAGRAAARSGARARDRSGRRRRQSRGGAARRRAP